MAKATGCRPQIRSPFKSFHVFCTKAITIYLYLCLSDINLHKCLCANIHIHHFCVCVRRYVYVCMYVHLIIKDIWFGFCPCVLSYFACVFIFFSLFIIDFMNPDYCLRFMISDWVDLLTRKFLLWLLLFGDNCPEKRSVLCFITCIARICRGWNNYVFCSDSSKINFKHRMMIFMGDRSFLFDKLTKCNLCLASLFIWSCIVKI